jgi:hypothetical protein
MKDQEDLRMSEQGKEIRAGGEASGERAVPWQSLRVGDRVRRRNPAGGNYVGTVESLPPSFVIRGASGVVHNPDETEGEFYLIVSELEELVRKVNEGAEAKARLLSEFREQVVQERKLYEGRSFPGEEFETLLYTYRVKPKTFTPFNVGKGWKVELSEDRKILTIGCQSWRKEEARPKFSVGFKILSEGREQGLRGFFGSKLGLRHQDTGETIPWADVDRIIAELEKVGA